MADPHRGRALWLSWLALVVAAPVFASEPRVEPDTAALMVSLHRGHQDQIALAAIAEEGAEREEVKAFAAKVRRDHVALDAKLGELASELNVDLEPQRPELASGEARKRRRVLLEDTEGAELDRLYLDAVVDINRSQAKQLRRAGPGIENRKVKEHAADVREHLERQSAEARSLQRVFIALSVAVR